MEYYTSTLGRGKDIPQLGVIVFVSLFPIVCYHSRVSMFKILFLFVLSVVVFD